MQQQQQHFHGFHESLHQLNSTANEASSFPAPWTYLQDAQRWKWKKRIFLCRHGETPSNRKRQLQGSGINQSLNSRGQWQAQQMAKSLQRYFSGQNRLSPLLVSSELKRAVETATVLRDLVATTEFLTFSELREICWGQWEGLQISDEQMRLLLHAWNPPSAGWLAVNRLMQVESLYTASPSTTTVNHDSPFATNPQQLVQHVSQQVEALKSPPSTTTMTSPITSSGQVSVSTVTSASPSATARMDFTSPDPYPFLSENNGNSAPLVGDFEAKVMGGESPMDCLRRCIPRIVDLIHTTSDPTKEIVMVLHGRLIRIILAYLLLQRRYSRMLSSASVSAKEEEAETKVDLSGLAYMSMFHHHNTSINVLDVYERVPASQTPMTISANEPSWTEPAPITEKDGTPARLYGPDIYSPSHVHPDTETLLRLPDDWIFVPVVLDDVSHLSLGEEVAPDPN